MEVYQNQKSHTVLKIYYEKTKFKQPLWSFCTCYVVDGKKVLIIYAIDALFFALLITFSLSDLLALGLPDAFV